jgi:mannose-6-phosphate isomerase-like protein (cupin superfamily)
MIMPLRILHVPEDAPISAPQQLGPYQIESLIPLADEGAGTAYRVRIAPHSTTSVSYHKLAEEIYFVIRGSGTALLNDVPHSLKTGDFLRLPPGTTHGFITEEEPLVMLDIHSPGSRPDRDVFFVGEAPQGFGKA